MGDNDENKKVDSDKALFFKRILKAPGDLVFKVWTDPEHIAKWWGPSGFRTTIHKMEVMPGGKWEFILHGPYGVDFPNKIVYIEVVRPERLVYFHGSDQKDDPGQCRVTVTFRDLGHKTKLTMGSEFRSMEDRDYVIEYFDAVKGVHQTLDRLEAHLAKLTKTGKL